jgi:cytochrome c biogenesis protein CcdA
MVSKELNSDHSLKYLILLVGVFIVALAGYGGFVLYSRISSSGSAGAGLLILAIMAGTASLFSPCSFPLLLTLLAREAGGQGEIGISRMRMLRPAFIFSLGVTTFLLLLGALLALGAAPLLSSVTFASPAGRLLRGIVGSLLIGLGIWQLRGKSLSSPAINSLLQPMWAAQSRWRRQRTSMSYGLYGFGYILAGFG